MQRRALLRLALCLPLVARAEWRRDHEDRCQRIDEQLRDIETERRIGYTPKRGRALEARREKLTKERRERCR